MIEMFGIGIPEFIVMGAIVLLLIGSTRLPKLARSYHEPAGTLQKGFKAQEPKKTHSKSKDKAPE